MPAVDMLQMQRSFAQAPEKLHEYLGQSNIEKAVRLSAAKSRQRARLGLCGFLLTVLRRCHGFERKQKPPGHHCNFLDCRFKRGFVCLRWLAESADFADELESRCSNLVIGSWRFEIEKDFYIAAHGI